MSGLSRQSSASGSPRQGAPLSGQVAELVSPDRSGLEPGPRPRRSGQRTREIVAAYGFLSPWLAGLLGLTLGPMLYSLYLSFTRYNLLTPPRWLGWGNYQEMISDDRLHKSIEVTLVYVVIAVPAILLVSLAVAVVLNHRMRLLSFYRAAFYLPSLVGASVAVALLWRQLFAADGVFNALLGVFGIEGQTWIGDPDTALYTLILLSVWTFGAPMIIFLAGLRQVPSDLYEAAEVDGAGRFRRFLNVTLPILSPLIFFNVLLTTVNAFQVFTPAYVVSEGSGGPADSTLFYTLYLYQRGFINLDMGYASAMAWTLLVALGIFTAVMFATSRFWVFYGDER
jgi:multiple sugar transport system permease protein